jgi:hypothetical protein
MLSFFFLVIEIWTHFDNIIQIELITWEAKYKNMPLPTLMHRVCWQLVLKSTSRGLSAGSMDAVDKPRHVEVWGWIVNTPYEFALINQWINALNLALFLTWASPGCLGQAEARRRGEQLSTRPSTPSKGLWTVKDFISSCQFCTGFI